MARRGTEAHDLPQLSRAHDLISFDGVSHRFGQVAAVQDVELHVGDAETVALIGPSGCGKSTLLRLAIGLLAPDRGRILINDREVRADTLREIRHRVGYVIQAGGLFPHLTAIENVTLAARHLRRESRWIDSQIGTLADLVRLPHDLLQRYPAELSGGQRQRISLMRALMLDPEVLLLDEPLGALDPMVRFELQAELRDLFTRLKKSVVLVTHDLAEAAFFSRHLALMRDGRIVQQGSYEDLTRAPVEPFVTDFIKAQRGLRDRLAGSADV